MKIIFEDGELMVGVPDEHIGRVEAARWGAVVSDAILYALSEGRKQGREDVIKIVEDKTFFMVRDHLVPIIREELGNDTEGNSKPVV